MIPTLVLHETFSRLDDSAVVARYHAPIRPRGGAARWDVTGMVARAGWTEADFEAFRRSRANQDLFVRLFAAAGGRIAAGTDASNQLLIPGYSLHREMQLLVGRRALRRATR